MTWILRLYVNLQTSASQRALRNAQDLVRRCPAGSITLEVVDLEEEPEASLADRVVAVPALLRISPPPIRRVIGDLSTLDSVLLGLGLYDHEAFSEDDIISESQESAG